MVFGLFNRKEKVYEKALQVGQSWKINGDIPTLDDVKFLCKKGSYSKEESTRNGVNIQSSLPLNTWGEPDDY